MDETRTILYLVRQPPDEALSCVVGAQLAAGAEVELLLVQDGVMASGLPAGASVSHLREDAETREVTGPGEAVDYGHMLEILHAADAAIVW
jgi:hypothetical protein